MELKTIQLGQILSDPQLKRVAEIMSSTQGLDRKSETLKNYLKQFHGELEAKGVDSAYLAYAIVFTKDIRQQWRIRTRKDSHAERETSGKKARRL